MIPLPYYTPVFIYLILTITLIVWVQTIQYEGREKEVIRFNKVLAYSLLIFTILYMGYRPISGRYFGDTETYAAYFQRFAEGAVISSDKEIVFNSFMKVCSKVMDIHQFFTLCSLLYILPLYLACRKWFRRYYLLAFLMLLGAFSFWPYGTNGVRNGIATSLVIMGIAWSNRKWMSVALFSFAIGIHTSVYLPILAFGITFFVKNTKYYLWGWALCIVLSLAFGGFWENFFARLGFGDDRMSAYLLSDEFNYQFSSIGFRWDFLLYSAIPVYMGYHYIFQRGYKNKMYIQLFNTYLVANAFWILVIRASFSNRFAYLSWFLIPIILVYPLLRKTVWSHQYPKIGILLVMHFLFTYIMFLKG